MPRRLEICVLNDGLWGMAESGAGDEGGLVRPSIRSLKLPERTSRAVERVGIRLDSPHAFEDEPNWTWSRRGDLCSCKALWMMTAGMPAVASERAPFERSIAHSSRWRHSIAGTALTVAGVGRDSSELSVAL
jgi:hypothetical protein